MKFWYCLLFAFFWLFIFAAAAKVGHEAEQAALVISQVWAVAAILSIESKT